MSRIVLALTLMFSLRASAEPKPALPPLSPLKDPEASLSPLRLDANDLRRIERRATYKRDVGIGLSIPGVTMIVLGAVLIGAGAKDDRLVAGAAEIAAGSISAGVGLAFTIPGALLWIRGQDDLDVAAWRRRQLAIP
jgi:hypothetical protein